MPDLINPHRMENKKNDLTDENAESRETDEHIYFSEFSSVHSKCPHTVTLEHFMKRLTGDEFKCHVGKYRTLLSQPGQEAEARKLKNATPAISPATICFGGHAASDIRQHSHALCVDLDHTDGRTEEIKRLASRLPWVLAAFISISGKGVKILVRIRPEDLADGYLPLYLAVGDAVSSHVAHPYDTQCKAPTQLCYYSYDPDAYYNPRATPFLMTDEAREKARLRARATPNGSPSFRAAHRTSCRALRRTPKRTPPASSLSCAASAAKPPSPGAAATKPA